MEETKWLTKTKIIIFSSIVLVIGLVIIFIVVNRHNLKKQYIQYEEQLKYAASNYLKKEKIELKDNQWRKIKSSDILKEKLLDSKSRAASDCTGYTIAYKKTTITYDSYIKCGKLYTTKGYGETPDSGKQNTTQPSKTTTTTPVKIDTTKPEIKLNGDEKVNLFVGDKYEELGATAKDDVDGDITKKIKISGKVNTKKEGTYVVKYTVIDSSGNKASITRSVIVEEDSDLDDLDDLDDYDDWNESDDGDYDDNLDDYDDNWGDYDDWNDSSSSSTPTPTPTPTPVIPKKDTIVSVKAVTITPNNKTLTVGSTYNLTVTVSPSNATNKSITFSSSNTKVATVDSNGMVRAVSKGNSVITAISNNGKTGTCVIKVN